VFAPVKPLVNSPPSRGALQGLGFDSSWKRGVRTPSSLPPRWSASPPPGDSDAEPGDRPGMAVSPGRCRGPTRPPRQPARMRPPGVRLEPDRCRSQPSPVAADPAQVCSSRRASLCSSRACRSCSRALAARSGCPNCFCNTADTTERAAGMLVRYLRPARRISGRAGYRSWLLVALVVVAVAHRRLGPSSSATTSTVDRALPSAAVQLRCWSRPTTTTRLPLARDSAACSAWSRQTITVKNDGSCSLRPDTATGTWPGRSRPRWSGPPAGW
jgi:hypothetical protein